MSRIFASKKRYSCFLAGALVCASYIPLSHAGSDPVIGDIMMFAGSFCPRGYADANGSLLAISQNNALFSLFGTIYGGDGRSTFGLPDLRGRVPVGEGNGPGLSNRPIGQKSGQQSVNININQMPVHSHAAITTTTLQATNNSGTLSDPSNNILANDGSDDIYHPNEVSSGQMALGAITSTTTLSASGGNTSIQSEQAYTVIRYCVALVGTYPSRN